MDIFFQLYDRFLSVFPVSTQWFVSLIVVISIVVAFYVLIRFHWVFILLLVILVPFLVPALKEVFTDFYQAFIFVWDKLGVSITISQGK
ncbi:hypothetical protein COY62_00625 [bacterium (Candidatus Howlettbacteria) CG_4_10_14_0_8_um_filter_40_9]|nr:MAG: hypothetical protein COY62_00625 [bacterium (Candidatus Howlettbacteria) CG_4_10_14_0_8_um_filter_40_9]